MLKELPCVLSAVNEFTFSFCGCYLLVMENHFNRSYGKYNELDRLIGLLEHYIFCLTNKKNKGKEMKAVYF